MKKMIFYLSLKIFEFIHSKIIVKFLVLKYLTSKKNKQAVSIVKYLISLNKIDLDAKDNDGKTALFYASENDKLDLVQFLIKSHKFDYDDQDNKGKTILHYACKTNDFDLVYFITSLGAVTTIKDNEDSTILHYSCQSGNQENARLILI